MEKDIHWDLRKIERNDEHVTSAEQTDGHWNSSIRDFHSRGALSHLIAVSGSWIKPYQHTVDQILPITTVTVKDGKIITALIYIKLEV